MFGFGVRERAVRAAIEGTQPYLTMLHGLPPGYWDDPYVLGFLFGTIGAFAKAATSGKITGVKLGYAVGEALGTLSGDPVIIRRANALGLQAEPSFEKGQGEGLAIVCFALGIRSQHPLLEAAREAVDQRGVAEVDRKKEISSAMIETSYFRELSERFEIDYLPTKVL